MLRKITLNLAKFAIIPAAFCLHSAAATPAEELIADIKKVETGELTAMGVVAKMPELYQKTHNNEELEALDALVAEYISQGWIEDNGGTIPVKNKQPGDVLIKDGILTKEVFVPYFKTFISRTFAMNRLAHQNIGAASLSDNFRLALKVLTKDFTEAKNTLLEKQLAGAAAYSLIANTLANKAMSLKAENSEITTKSAKESMDITVPVGLKMVKKFDEIRKDSVLNFILNDVDCVSLLKEELNKFK